MYRHFRVRGMLPMLQKAYAGFFPEVERMVTELEAIPAGPVPDAAPGGGDERVDVEDVQEAFSEQVKRIEAVLERHYSGILPVVWGLCAEW
jgi:hypothetical protein